jgi:hypothetical protein
MSDAIDRMRAEAKRIKEASLLAAERHYAAETPWYHWNYSLGIPSTVLAAAAGAAAFSKYGVVAGGISIVVAVLSSLTTFLDPNKRASIHHASAKAYEALYHSAGFFYRFESLNDNADTEDLEQKLSALNSAFLELNKSSAAIGGRAYRIADENIKEKRGEVVRDSADL